MNVPPVFRYAINRQVRNKTNNVELLTSGFRDETGTLEALKDLLTVEGHAFCVCLLGNRRRKSENFVGSWFVGIDIDNTKPLLDEFGKPVKDADGHAIKVFDHQMTTEDALAHPFVREHCWLAYTTSSHTESHHRLRLLFRLPEYIEKAELYAETIQLVAAQVPHDKACTDEARAFYGNDAAEVILFNPDAVLPDYNAEAQQRLAATKEAAALQAQKQAQRRLQQQQANPQDLDDLIDKALSYIPARTPGTGTYDLYRASFQGLVLHYGPDRALPIIEQHSPHVRAKGGKNGHSGWNPRQFVWNVRGGATQASLGSLFYHAKQHGFEFPKRDWVKTEWQPTPEEIAALKQQEAEQEAIEDAQAVHAEQQRRLAYRQGTNRIQDALNSLTHQPDVLLNQRYLPPVPLGKGGTLTALSSVMKSGKTAKVIVNWVIEHRQRFPDSQVFLLGYRNMLLQQIVAALQAKNLPASHVSDMDESSDLHKRPIVALCLDSLGRLDPAKIKPETLIIVDECDAVLKHGAGGGTLGSRQSFILNRWHDILERLLPMNGRLLVCEADLTDLSLDAYQAMSGLKRNLIVNEHKSDACEVEVCTGSFSGYVARITADLEAGKRVAIATDSQRKGEILHKLISKMLPHLRIRRVDSITAETEWVKAFMKAPDTGVEEVDVLIYSPTAESGLSINKDWFDHVYCIAINLETRAQLQMAFRVRQPVPRTVYTHDFAPNTGDLGRSLRPKVLMNDQRRSVKQTAMLTQVESQLRTALAEAIEDDPDDALTVQRFERQLTCLSEALQPTAGSRASFWNALAAKYRARENGARADMKGRLVKTLHAQGHTVTETALEEDTETAEQLKLAKAAVEYEKATEMYEADLSEMDMARAERILSSNDSKYSDRVAAHKFLLQERDFPGINLNFDFLLKRVVRDYGAFLRKATLDWLVDHPEIATVLDWKRFKSETMCPFIMYRRLSHNRAQVDLLLQLGIKPFCDGREYQEADDLVQELRARTLKHTREIKRVLGLTFAEEKSGIYIVNELARKLSYTPKRVRKVGPRGKQVCVYQVVDWDDPDRHEIRAALDRKWATTLEQSQEQSPSLEQEAPAALVVTKTFISDDKGLVTTAEKPERPLTPKLVLVPDLELKGGASVPAPAPASTRPAAAGLLQPGDVVSVAVAGRVEAGVVVQVPNHHPDPQQCCQAWLVRLEHRGITHVWDAAAFVGVAC